MANRRVKVTITGTYELIPEYYENGMTPEQMVKADESNANMGVEDILVALGDSVDLKFELVEE